MSGRKNKEERKAEVKPVKEEKGNGNRLTVFFFIMCVLLAAGLAWQNNALKERNAIIYELKQSVAALSSFNNDLSSQVDKKGE